MRIDPELSASIDQFLADEDREDSGLIEDYDTDRLYEERRYGEIFGKDDEQ